MKKRILVLCTGNSCRSQMAEAYLKKFAQDKADIYSAGIEAHGLNPNAVLIMLEDGIDISNQTSNQVEDYKHLNFDFVITVCDNANEHCPVFPSSAVKIHQNFPDPAKAEGTKDEIERIFRQVRQMIKDFSIEFVSNQLV